MATAWEKLTALSTAQATATAPPSYKESLPLSIMAAGKTRLPTLEPNSNIGFYQYRDFRWFYQDSQIWRENDRHEGQGRARG